MSNVWHNPPQTPDVFKSHPIIVVYEAGDQIEQMDSKEYSDLVGERYVNRWCYVDDLIKENDRTRKALDVATGFIKGIAQTIINDGDNLYVVLGNFKKFAEDTLNKIKITPEQKE